MLEPTLMGFPLTQLILYFFIYSFLGWGMETVYCSIGARRLVTRGFLYGPICPIYGVGVLLMIVFFEPLAGNLPLFYVVSTIVMSVWEYFVGWFLETTTHIKYWDYSMYRFNLKGRICLWVCLAWGALSYVAIFWIHPPIARLVTWLPDWARYSLTGVLVALVVVDAVITIRKLALTAKLMKKLEVVGQELQLQLALGKAELGDRLEAAKDGLSDRLAAAKEGIADRVDTALSATGAAIPRPVSESAEKLKARYDEILAAAERQSRRFRKRYSEMSSQSYAERLEDVKASGAALASRVLLANRTRKAEKKARRAAKKNGK
ncbi:MAG: hypothetical protein RSB55_02945 [Oscillospiraceae bacterium]